MGNAAFLLVAVAVSIVGSLWLWWNHRRPRRSMSSVEEFQREMEALGRRPSSPSRTRRRAMTRHGRSGAPGGPSSPPSDGPRSEGR